MHKAVSEIFLRRIIWSAPKDQFEGEKGFCNMFACR